MTSSASSIPVSGKCRKFPVEIRSVNERRSKVEETQNCFIHFQYASHVTLQKSITVMALKSTLQRFIANLPQTDASALF